MRVRLEAPALARERQSNAASTSKCVYHWSHERRTARRRASSRRRARSWQLDPQFELASPNGGFLTSPDRISSEVRRRSAYDGLLSCQIITNWSGEVLRLLEGASRVAPPALDPGCS